MKINKINIIFIAIIISLITFIFIQYISDNYYFSFEPKKTSEKTNQTNFISIAELRQLPVYSKRFCYISGYVTKVIDVPLVSDDFYKITDGTAEVWVISNSGLPPIRSNVQLYGKLINIGKKFEYMGITMEVFRQVKLNIIK